MADLGFRWTVRKTGEVAITHNGRPAGKLRGDDAAAFLEYADPAAPEDLARLTGNYKRGNERLAKSHPRNR